MLFEIARICKGKGSDKIIWNNGYGCVLGSNHGGYMESYNVDRRNIT